MSCDRPPACPSIYHVSRMHVDVCMLSTRTQRIDFLLSSVWTFLFFVVYPVRRCSMAACSDARCESKAARILHFF
jgi:hypothetical protein